MEITLRAFGSLSDLIKTTVFTLPDGADSDSLLLELTAIYPALAYKKFMLTVDKKSISESTLLHEGCTVALLPPFSGG